MILYYFYNNKYLLHSHCDFSKSNQHPHQLGVHQSKKKNKRIINYLYKVFYNCHWHRLWEHHWFLYRRPIRPCNHFHYRGFFFQLIDISWRDGELFHMLPLLYYENIEVDYIIESPLFDNCIKSVPPHILWQRPIPMPLPLSINHIVSMRCGDINRW